MIGIKPEVRPIETVTPIKPSEAIRLGCLLAPVQAFGHYGFGDEACAIGAMNLGWGHSPGTWIDESALNPKTAQGPCPEPGCPGFSRIPHLNDDHRWSRERIADWLESIGL